MEQISLEWADKIRERLRNRIDGKLFKDIPEVQEFIKPILEYAKAQEIRLDRGFKR